MKWSEVTQSFLTLYDPVDCSPPGSSVHGILQARILEWVAISFSNYWMANVLFLWNTILKGGVEDGKLSREGGEAIKVALLSCMSIRWTASSVSQNRVRWICFRTFFWGNQGRNKYLSTPDLHWSKFHSIDFRLLTSMYEIDIPKCEFLLGINREALIKEKGM